MGNIEFLNEKISRAVSVFRTSRDLGDVEIYKALVVEGFEEHLAARLVEFLPIAYSRATLTNSGARFPDAFQRRLSDGGLSASKPLSSEPVWESVVAYVKWEVKQGVSGKDILALAARSAEFNAANQLLNKGSKLEHLTFTPIVLMWPEHGPPR